LGRAVIVTHPRPWQKSLKGGSAMETMTKPGSAVKTQIVSVEPFAISEGDLGILITTLTGKRGCCTLYRAQRVEGCTDLAFTLTKLHSPGSDPEAESYCVNLSLSTCECKGHLRHGTACKHLTACRSLWERGCLS
jgi:hypothetical protein